MNFKIPATAATSSRASKPLINRHKLRDHILIRQKFHIQHHWCCTSATICGSFLYDCVFPVNRRLKVFHALRPVTIFFTPLLIPCVHCRYPTFYYKKELTLPVRITGTEAEQELTAMVYIMDPVDFSIKPMEKQYEDPFMQAEYAYSLLESEGEI